MSFTPAQLDYLAEVDVDPVEDPAEAAYTIAEREGMRLDGVCADCPGIGDCQAEGQCIGRADAAFDSSPTLAEWDVIA
jgi:hypothetical protein